jgi:putative FmdB family regulatory protein
MDIVKKDVIKWRNLMPIYEYVCRKCSEKFSVLRGICSSKKIACPQCSSQEVKKIFSAFSCASGSENSASSPPSRGYGGG